MIPPLNYCSFGPQIRFAKLHMTWKTLFFGFDGRIGRRQWWFATLTLLLVSLPLSMLVNPGAYFEAAAGAGSRTAEALLDFAFLIPQTAISLKRFNDRDWPQWMPYGLAIITTVLLLLSHFGVIFSKPDFATLELWIVWAMATAIIAVIFDNGLLRGTVGPNRHGPDPLAAQALPPPEVSAMPAPAQPDHTGTAIR